MWSRPLATRRSIVWSLALVLAAPSPPLAASAPLPLFVSGSVKRAVALAAERLADEECRAIYEEFQDASGVTLAEKLRREDADPTEHLRTIRWVNGVAHPRCRDPRIYLVTSVGARVVFVCPAQFGELALRNPREAAGLVLHEQLHALGLGENPPASEEISRRVFARCGR
jgi:hypothetical protein